MSLDLVFSNFTHDLRCAVRQFRRGPGLALTAVGSLALGIGFLAVVVALIATFFLRPLPYSEPDRLVHIWQTDARSGNQQMRVSVATFEDWRDQTQQLEDLAGYYYSTFTETRQGGTNGTVNGSLVTLNLFDVLGVEAARGRTFDVDDPIDGAGSPVLVSERFWRSRFAGDDHVLGREIELDGVTHPVIGVLPAEFVFPFNSMDVWLPMPSRRDDSRRAAGGPLMVFGRLAEGASPVSAQAEMDAITARLAERYPEASGSRGAEIVDLRSVLLFTWDIFRVVFPALLLAVCFVLALVCANLGNLLLTRLADRQAEFARRLALGASRSRLVGQLMIESLLLGVVGTGLGLVFAWFGARALEQVIPLDLYRVGAISLDHRSVGAALVACLVTVVLFGVLPALGSVRPQLATTLRAGQRGSESRESRRLRNALVVVQMALAVLLVSGTALMGRAFLELQAIETGFDTNRLTTLEVTLPAERYENGEQRNRFYEALGAQLAAIPGVEQVTNGYPLPLNHESLSSEIEVRGVPVRDDQTLEARTFWAGDDYFGTLGIPVLEGRGFDSRDAADGAATVLVNRALVERYLGGEAVGRELRVGERWYEVVGVVADSVTAALGEEVPPVVYYSQHQFPLRRRFLYLRGAAGAPPPDLEAIRQSVVAIDADQPLENVRPMAQVVRTSYGPWMIGLGGVSGLGFGALLLAAVGVYGLVGYSVSRRTREFGVRRALGADRGEMMRLVLGEGIRLCATGIGIGFLGVVAMSRSLRSLLFGVSPFDPLALISVALVLGLATVVASYVPARRAATVSASEALRHEG